MPTVQFLKDQEEGFFVDTPSSATIGETATYTCNYWDTPSSATMTVYRSAYGTGNGKDVTSAVVSGSITYGTTSAILKPIDWDGGSTLTGNAAYKVVVLATVGSQPTSRYFFVAVTKAESFG